MEALSHAKNIVSSRQGDFLTSQSLCGIDGQRQDTNNESDYIGRLWTELR